MDEIPAELQELAEALDTPDEELSFGSAEGGWKTPSAEEWAQAEQEAAEGDGDGPAGEGSAADGDGAAADEQQ